MGEAGVNGAGGGRPAGRAGGVVAQRGVMTRSPSPPLLRRMEVAAQSTSAQRPTVNCQMGRVAEAELGSHI